MQRTKRHRHRMSPCPRRVSAGISATIGIRAPVSSRGSLERALGTAILSVVALGVIVGGAIGSAASAGLEPLGRLDAGTATPLIVDAETRRLMELSNTRPLEVTVYDADRLRREATVEFSRYALARRVFEFDEAAGVLYVVAESMLQPPAEGLFQPGPNPADPRLVSVDTRSMQIVSDVPLAGHFPPGFQVVGLALHGGTLFLAAQPRENFLLETAPVLLVGVNPSSAAITWGPHPVRGCRRAVLSSGGQATVVPSADGVFLVCDAPTVVAGPPLPGTAAVVEIPSNGDPGRQRAYFLPGRYRDPWSFYDEEGQRLILAASGGAWVFDVHHRRFVGQLSGGEIITSAGFNPESGRLYLGFPDWTLVGGVRGVELPQGVEVDGVGSVGGWITTVAFNHTVLVPASGGGMIAYRDRLPDSLFRPPEPVRYGQFDKERSETRQFTADARAFGFHSRLVGGLRSLPGASPLFNAFGAHLGALGLQDGQRDVFAARVSRAHLGELEASAGAISAQADEFTAMNRHALTRQDWPFEEATCLDLGGAETSVSEEGATAECRLGKGQVEAAATGSTLAISGLAIPAVSLGDATATVGLRLDRKRGLTVFARSEATDIVVGDQVRIGRVISEVQVAAFGRPRTADASYQRTFEDVKAGDFSCGKDCNLTRVLASLTETLAGEFRVEFPTQEERETRGGAHAHAFRETREHQEDIVLNNQDPLDVEVPALRLVAVNDGASASRLILNFAATAGASTFLPLGPGLPDPEFDDLGDVPGAYLPQLVGPSASSAELPDAAPEEDTPSTVTEVLARGWRFLVGPRSFLHSAALWGLLIAPLFFAARRRHLLRLGGGR